MLSGNIGEWSEVYVLFKILSEGKLYSATGSPQTSRSKHYPVERVFRRDIGRHIEYRINEFDVEVLLENHGTVGIRPSRKNISTAANILYSALKSRSGSFSVPEVQTILEDLHINTLKAPSLDKADIELSVHDDRTNDEVKLSFSIKSEIGSPATLLNASQATNFQFYIEGGTEDLLGEEFGQLKVKKLVQKLENDGFELFFSKIKNAQFNANLMLIDFKMPLILATMLLDYYRSNATTTIDLLALTVDNDPAEAGLQVANFYEHKIKMTLMDIALGMKPSHKWTGSHDATGGYIIVEEEGDVNCLNSYNREEFMNYLVNRTKFDTPGTERHNFGSIYIENDDFYIDLNLQIRFE